MGGTSKGQQIFEFLVITMSAAPGKRLYFVAPIMYRTQLGAEGEQVPLTEMGDFPLEVNTHHQRLG